MHVHVHNSLICNVHVNVHSVVCFNFIHVHACTYTCLYPLYTGLCMPNTCLPGYRPYTCTSCIQFTKKELAFSSNICDSPDGRLLQMMEVDDDVLRRYMEVYNRTLYWTGYKLDNGKAIVPGTNNSIPLDLVGSPNCSDCCVAWLVHGDDNGPIALECNKMLPAICTTSLNCKFLDTFVFFRLPLCNVQCCTCTWKKNVI